MYSQEDVKKALDVLYNGGIILYPTDTIWGLGCDATNKDAVAKIYKLKNRSDSKSMLSLVANDNMLSSYVRDIPEVAWELIEISDKPITIIYPEIKNLAPNLLAEDGSAGIRVVRDVFCEALIRKFRKPLVSTSANTSNLDSPKAFDDIEDRIKEAVDYVVKYRQNDLQPLYPSSIIKLNLDGTFKILR